MNPFLHQFIKDGAGGKDIDTITTFTKIHIDPVNPRPELICIEDIAHALSMMCRANGHFPAFYSVAQHSINCCGEAKARGYSERLQLACLLHDASEAYLSDVTRPVKRQLPGYREAEKRLQDMIWEKWLSGIPDEGEHRLIKQVDDALLYHEFMHFMDERILPDQPALLSKPVFESEDFAGVKKRLVNTFNLHLKLILNKKSPNA